METRKFKNGFENWHETHFEIVSHITRIADTKENYKINLIQCMQGIGGLYELAKDLTDKFEEQNEGREWDGDFFDEIELFLQKEL